MDKLEIKNKEDLKKVLKFLDDQGFGYISEYELHNKKINSIISKSNKLGVKYDADKLKTSLQKLGNYSDIEKESNLFFSKFGVNDKINEYINMFYIQSADYCKTPWTRPDSKEIIEWVDFKKKYKLADEFDAGHSIYYYNLDANFIKVHFSDYKMYEFKNFYKLVFDEECVDFDQRKTGFWIKLGKIEIKLFQNGYANIKGDLKKLKEYYYQYIKSSHHNNTNIIKYNSSDGQLEIIKGTKD